MSTLSRVCLPRFFWPRTLTTLFLFVLVRETYQHQSRLTMEQTREIQQLNEQLAALQQSVANQNALIQSLLAQNGVGVVAGAVPGAAPTAVAAANQQQIQQQQQQVHVHVNVAGANNNQQEQPQPVVVNPLEDLRPSDQPLLPNIPDKMAKTIPECLHKINEFRLILYKNPDRVRGWPTKHRIMLEKYLYVYSRLSWKASNPNFRPHLLPTSRYMDERLSEAAEVLETQRLALRTDRGKPFSVDKWIKHLKATLPEGQGGSRKRKSRGLDRL